MATRLADIQTVEWTVDLAGGILHLPLRPAREPDGDLLAAGAALPAPPLTPEPVITREPTPAPAPASAPAPVTPVATVASASSTTSLATGSSGLGGLAGTLSVTLTAKGKLVVTKSGKPVGNLDTGRYKLSSTTPRGGAASCSNTSTARPGS